MKHLINTGPLIALVGLVASACSVDTSTDASSEALGEVEAPLCSNPDGVPQLLAALAVASMRELGRLEARKDFAQNGSYLELSTDGRALCTARGGCNNIDALLAFQQPSATAAKVDPWKYAAALVNNWQKQRDYELYTNTSSAEDHALSFEKVENGVCGKDFWFQAVKPSCATGGTGIRLTAMQKAHDRSTTEYSTQINLYLKLRNDGKDSVDLSKTKVRYYFTADGASNWAAVCYDTPMGCSKVTSRVVYASSGAYVEFGFTSGTLNAGRESDYMQLGLKKSDWSTVNRTNDYSWVGAYVSDDNQPYKDVSSMAVTYNGGLIGGSSPGYDSLPNYDPSTNTNCKLGNPGAIKNKLMFAGGDTNQFLAFDSTATMVKVDPTDTLVGGSTTTTSGACLSACSAYDATRSSTGNCCVCNGTYGSLAVSAFSPSMYVCR